MVTVSASVNACDGRISLETKAIEGKASWTTSQGTTPLQAKLPRNESETWTQFI